MVGLEYVYIYIYLEWLNGTTNEVTVGYTLQKRIVYSNMDLIGKNNLMQRGHIHNTMGVFGGYNSWMGRGPIKQKNITNQWIKIEYGFNGGMQPNM